MTKTISDSSLKLAARRATSKWCRRDRPVFYGASKGSSGRGGPLRGGPTKGGNPDMPFLATEWGRSSRPVHLLKQFSGVGPLGPGWWESPFSDGEHAASWVALKLSTVHPNPGPGRGKRGGMSEENRGAKNERRREMRRARGRGEGVDEGGGNGRQRGRREVRVVTWNLQRMSMREQNRRKLREVAKFIESQGWEIVLMTEIWADGEGVVWLGEGTGRVAIVHGMRTGILLRGEMVERWVDEGELKWYEERVTVVAVAGMRLMAVYQPVWLQGRNDVEVYRHQIHNQMATVRQRELLVIGGDHNAQVGRDGRREGVVGAWGLSTATNEAGWDFVDWCEEHGLAYVNSYYRHRRRGTWFSTIHHRWYELDGFVVRNQDRHKWVKKAATVNVDSYSDHRPKMIVLKTGVKAWRNEGRGARRGQVRWEVLKTQEGSNRFREETRRRWEDSENTGWEKVSEVLRESAMEVCGMRERRVENPWTVGREEELEDMRRGIQHEVEERNMLLGMRRTRAREERLRGIRERLKRARKELKRRMRRWEREWWEMRILECQQAQDSGDIGSMYKILREIGIGNMKKAPASTTLTLEDFRSQFSEVSKERYEEDPRSLRRRVERVEHREYEEEDEEVDEFLNETPGEEEIREEMRKVKDSAPGEDQVRMCYINLACEQVKAAVVNLIQFMFENRGDRWEQALKVGMVVPIFKKGDRNSSNNYRGVCLLAMASRILGRVLASRLRWWAELKGLMDENQSGFRKGRSTADATQIMIRIEEDVSDYKKRVHLAGGGEGRQPEARLLDLRKAYPRISRPVMWALLERYGLTGNMMDAVRDLHETAVYKVKGKAGVSKEWQPQRGLREGCPTSPILFNIYHQAVMRQAEEERRQAAGREGETAGVEWSWVPGGGFPGVSLWERKHHEARTSRIETILFADDTTLVGERGEIEGGQEK